jgi:hypothetical protein
MIDPFAPVANPPRPTHVLAGFYPEGLPGDYVVINVQTSGLDPDEEHVLGVTSLMVKGGKIAQRDHQLLNWAPVLTPGQYAWLHNRLVEADGRTLSPEALASGCDPRAALAFYRDVLVNLPPNVPLVGHMLLELKWPVLHRNLHAFGGLDFMLDPLIHDLGMWEKAIGAYLYPEPDESLGHFQVRVALSHEVGVPWSFRHCTEQHGAEPEVPPGDPFYTVRALHDVYESHRRGVAKDLNNNN